LKEFPFVLISAFVFQKKESDIHPEEKWNADYYDDYDKRR